MKKPEIDAYGWVNGKYYDDLSEAINPLIDALVEAHEAIKGWLDMNECDCEDGVHICGRPKKRRQLDLIKTALRDAGVEE